MRDSCQLQNKRRRLFTRRELRHTGTRIVRVGSSNVLETTRGQYNFAELDKVVQPSPLDNADRESITTFSERDSLDDAFANQQTAEAANNINSVPDRRRNTRRCTMHRLTQMSEKSRNLRVSPTQRRTLTSQVSQRPDVILPPSPIRLPPPLNLDRNILSFSQQTPLPRSVGGKAAYALSDSRPTASRQPLSAKRSNNIRHLTPLCSVQQRLKPTRTKMPPAFSLDKLSKSVQK
ncbi:hypothetical protein H4R24_003422 [Coemansia sp. RSA 988]|nr:hypothetical protein H4R24_003422 [Coemansia sp. RSA 988]